MKRAAIALAALTLGAFFWPGGATHGAIAVAATPTPVALQYDEISRMIVAPATPPAPGSFQVDYQAIVSPPSASSGDQSSNAQATPTPAPRKHGLAGMLGSVMSGTVPTGDQGDQGNAGPSMMGGAMQAMHQMQTGRLTRITSYKGWLRTDDPVAQTATISKCQEHQFIALNLAKKTYTLTNTQPACNTNPPMPMGPRHTVQENEAPGTAQLTMTATQQALGALTIDTIATNGFDNTVAISTTEATGSCRNGDVKMSIEQYVSKIAIPRRYCPLPRTTMESPTEYVTHGGCKPTMHMHGSASGITQLDRLIMFSKMTFGIGQNEQMSHMAMITERGNVKWFSGTAADAYFSVPPGFTQTQ